MIDNVAVGDVTWRGRVKRFSHHHRLQVCQLGGDWAMALATVLLSLPIIW